MNTTKTNFLKENSDSYRIKTQFFPAVFERKEADTLYELFQTNLLWEDGIYSNRAARVSRKAYIPFQDMPNFNEEPEEKSPMDILLEETVANCLKAVGRDSHYVYGTYVNYYRDGTDFCPAHSHKGQVQMVLSLGATRSFHIGDKIYPMNSGDCIVFGSSTHSIPIEPTVQNGRISIAAFLKLN